MAKKEVILGIGGYTTDASICLMVDGEIRIALEEERFTRRKHQGGWPRNAIQRAFKEVGLKESDTTHISFSYHPWLRVSRRLPFQLKYLPTRPKQATIRILEELRFVGSYRMHINRLREESRAKVFYLRHHLAHAASAFLSSPYEEAAFYTVDQRGEWDTTLWGTGRDEDIHVLGHTSYPDSLGLFYTGITTYLGFQGHDEYKVMGLAAYGRPVYLDRMYNVIHPAEQNKFAINPQYLNYFKPGDLFRQSFVTEKFEEEFGPPRREDEPVEERHMNIAASAQKIFEACVFHQLADLHRTTKTSNLCIAGGCGLNGVMNGNVYSNTPFESVFLPSAAGDDGLSLGGALYVRHKLLGHKRSKPLLRADLGTEYDNEEICRLLELYKLRYQAYDDIVPPTIELLQTGKIVGWFQGRMEFGARALGNRSILANPTLPGMKDKINKYVKFREEFRPFAPSVISEAAGDYFEMRDPIPFMTVVCKVKSEAVAKLPATTHVDGTARVHTVDREESPLYWRLIREFGEKTGVPVLLNTSFNVMGEPIVENPRQAIACFYSNGMDALVIGNCILVK